MAATGIGGSRRSDWALLCQLARTVHDLGPIVIAGLPCHTDALTAAGDYISGVR
jgi:hypothetical protein